MATHKSNNDVFKLIRTQYTQRHINSVGGDGLRWANSSELLVVIKLLYTTAGEYGVNHLLFVA